MSGLSTVMAGLCALVSLGAIGTGWLSADMLRAEKSPQFAKAADVTIREWPGFVAGPKDAPPPPTAIPKSVEEAKPAPTPAAVTAPAPAAAPVPIAAKPAPTPETAPPKSVAVAPAPVIPKPAAAPKLPTAPKPVAVAAPAALPAAEPAESAAPAEEGTLNLRASDSADVFIDGKNVGWSPVTGKKVEAVRGQLARARSMRDRSRRLLEEVT